jgi:hypothetical protein
MEVTISNLGIGSSIFASQQIFDKNNISKVVQESHKAMKLHTARYEKISPYDHFQTILHGSLDYLLEKMEQIYLPAGNFANIDTMKQIIAKVKQIPIYSPSDYKAVMEGLELLDSYNSMTPNPIIKARINDDLGYLINLLNLKINRELINNDYWNGKGARPDISTKTFREFEKLGTPIVDGPSEKGPLNWLGYVAIIAGAIAAVTAVGLLLRRKKHV